MLHLTGFQLLDYISNKMFCEWYSACDSRIRHDHVSIEIHMLVEAAFSQIRNSFDESPPNRSKSNWVHPKSKDTPSRSAQSNCVGRDSNETIENC